MRVFLLFALSGFAVLQSGQAQDMEPNTQCRRQDGNHKSPGDTWLTTSSDGLRHTWCECPYERKTGQALKAVDYCVGLCLWEDGPREYEGQSYHEQGDAWEYKDENGYTFECGCSRQGRKICGVKPGGHVCDISGEVHRPGDMGFVVEVGDVYSDRYEECDCPNVLPEGINRWSRQNFCRGVCFDEDNLPHYEGENYVDTLRKCFKFDCVCREHGGRDCDIKVDGGHQCVLGKGRYYPGVTWIRRTYERTNTAASYQECTCPLVWANKHSTFFNKHIHCRGICYQNATTTIYDEQSPYLRTDEDTGTLLSCECFNAGVEFCQPA